MVFYHGKRFQAATVGRRIVGVVCDECGCSYSYELARIGSGAESAPYGIGTGRAARSAQQQAGRDLERRLAEEAELVPCPKCHWINEELVAGYRRGRYRGWARAALGLGVAGSALSLVVAWFLSIGPVPDRDAALTAAVGGPAISIALAAALLLLRRFLRGRIDPNRDYPHPPRLPAGGPVALMENPATGTLEPVATTPAPGVGDGVGAWLDIQVGRVGFPPLCCDCLAPGIRSGYQSPLAPAVTLTLPLCRVCARRWAKRKWLGAVAALGVAAAIGLPVLLALKLDEIFFWPAAVGLGIVAPIVGAMIAGHLGAPVRVRVVDGSRGVARLWFRNEGFAEQASRAMATGR